MDINQTTEMVRQFHQHIGAPIADKPQLLADVLMGDAVACGLPAQKLFDEIYRSNMTKQFGVRTGVGKAYRGACYEPPRIREILEAAEEANER